MKRALLVATAAAVALTAGCSEWNDDRGKGDAPTDQQPDQHIAVWPNGDGFPNISAFCIGANGVYTTTREAAPAVVPDDPNCAEGGALTERGGR